MAKPNPTSQSLASTRPRKKVNFHVDGTHLENVDYDSSDPEANPSSVDISSSVAIWAVIEGKSQGSNKVKITAIALYDDFDEVVEVREDAKSGAFGLGDMTITITNSGGETGQILTNIDYQ